MFEFISHATMVGAFIVGVVLVIYQFCANIADAANAPEESEDERF